MVKRTMSLAEASLPSEELYELYKPKSVEEVQWMVNTKYSLLGQVLNIDTLTKY